GHTRLWERTHINLAFQPQPRLRVAPSPPDGSAPAPRAAASRNAHTASRQADSDNHKSIARSAPSAVLPLSTRSIVSLEISASRLQSHPARYGMAYTPHTGFLRSSASTGVGHSQPTDKAQHRHRSDPQSPSAPDRWHCHQPGRISQPPMSHHLSRQLRY